MRSRCDLSNSLHWGVRSVNFRHDSILPFHQGHQEGSFTSSRPLPGSAPTLPSLRTMLHRAPSRSKAWHGAACARAKPMSEASALLRCAVPKVCALLAHNAAPSPLAQQGMARRRLRPCQALVRGFSPPSVYRPEDVRSPCAHCCTEPPRAARHGTAPPAPVPSPCPGLQPCDSRPLSYHRKLIGQKFE